MANPPARLGAPNPSIEHDIPPHLHGLVNAALLLIVSINPRGFTRTDPKPNMVVSRPRVEALRQAIDKSLPGAIDEVREMARQKGWTL